MVRNLSGRRKSSWYGGRPLTPVCNGDGGRRFPLSRAPSRYISTPMRDKEHGPPCLQEAMDMTLKKMQCPAMYLKKLQSCKMSLAL